MNPRWVGTSVGKGDRAGRAAGPIGGSFVACPQPLQAGLVAQGDWARELYRLAYEQARAALEPARPNIHAVSWN